MASSLTRTPGALSSSQSSAIPFWYTPWHLLPGDVKPEQTPPDATLKQARLQLDTLVKTLQANRQA